LALAKAGRPFSAAIVIDESDYRDETTDEPQYFAPTGLPAGLAVDSGTGEISGIPVLSAVGSTTFRIVELRGKVLTYSPAITMVVAEADSASEASSSTPPVTPNQLPAEVIVVPVAKSLTGNFAFSKITKALNKRITAFIKTHKTLKPLSLVCIVEGPNRASSLVNAKALCAVSKIAIGSKLTVKTYAVLNKKLAGKSRAIIRISQ